ncbi:MAG TPA: sugar transferase, partial [Mycobacteriales bacterium]|nr:sugar transferase [Mycobacteriales bacterium]
MARARATETVPASPVDATNVVALPRQRSDEGTRGLRPGRRPFVYRTLLRWGVSPFFLAIDVLAFGGAVALTQARLADLWVFGITIVLYQLGALYRSRLTLSALDDAVAIVARAIASSATVAAAIIVLHRDDARAELILTGVLLGAFALAGRTIGYAAVRHARARGVVGHPTLILGAGRVGAQVVDLLHDHAEYGLRPVGYLDSDPLLQPSERRVPVLGGDDVLAQTIVEFGVRDVVVAFGSLPESMLVEVIRTCDKLDVEIFFVPRLFELYFTSRDVDLLWGFPLVRLRAPAFRSPAWRLKRAFDLLASGIALTILSPLMAVIALAVRLEGGPGVIFRQTRVGLDGRPFSVMKFRSLKPADETESQTNWNIAHDDRLGPIGKFLRQSSLDELPQLINILRGDMSIVGPRPERPHFVDQFAGLYPRYTARHRVPAGLTGWSQVHGLRGDTSIEERARFDNYYIENWTL